MTTMTSAAVASPFAAAMDTSQFERVYFGKVTTVDAWFVHMNKGEPKRLFDPSADNVRNRRTEIKLVTTSLNGEYTTERNFMDFDKGWREKCQPSLARHGIQDLSQLAGRYGRYRLIEYGSYVNASGETKARTTFVFDALYASYDEAQAAADAFFTGLAAPTATPLTVVPAAPAPVAPALPAAPLDPERKTAIEALPMLWALAAQNPEKFWDMVQANAALTKHFTPESPEITAIVGDALMPLPF